MVFWVLITCTVGVNTDIWEEHAVFVLSCCGQVILVGCRDGVQSKACSSKMLIPMRD